MGLENMVAVGCGTLEGVTDGLGELVDVGMGVSVFRIGSLPERLQANNDRVRISKEIRIAE